MPQSMQSLTHILDLIRKTGDRCVVLNNDGEEPYVVMSLPEYERLALGRSEVADLTEEQFLDKINRDIAVWKSQQEQEQNEGNEGFDEYGEEDENDFDEDPYYFENV